MQVLQVLLVISVYAYTVAEKKGKVKIINGENATIEEHPYQVSLMYHIYHLCGGSLIKSRVVLTAAHCTYRKDRKRFLILAGTSFRSGRYGVTSKIFEVYEHPKYYSSDTEDYDISILIIRPLPISRYIQPIEIIYIYDTLTPGSLGVVTGWGHVNIKQDLVNILQRVEVPLVSDDYCSKVYQNKTTDRMICFGYTEGGKDACQGDSGSPIAVNGKLVGLVSWGEGCALPNFPGVYTRLQNKEIYEFIMEHFLRY